MAIIMLWFFFVFLFNNCSKTSFAEHYLTLANEERMIKEFLDFCGVHCCHVSVLCKCLLTHLYTFWPLGIWNGTVSSWCTLCDHSIPSGVLRGKYLFKDFVKWHQKFTQENEKGVSNTWPFLLHLLKLISFPLSPCEMKCLSILVQKDILLLLISSKSYSS